MFPSNMLTTMLIEGRFSAFICMHHKRGGKATAAPDMFESNLFVFRKELLSKCRTYIHNCVGNTKAFHLDCLCKVFLALIVCNTIVGTHINTLITFNIHSGIDFSMETQENSGLGGICKTLMPPANMSTTKLIEGLCSGFICTHHKPTTIIFLTISSVSEFSSATVELQ